MDDTPYINDGADASLRKTVSLLNKLEAKTGSTGPVDFSGLSGVSRGVVENRSGILIGSEGVRRIFRANSKRTYLFVQNTSHVGMLVGIGRNPESSNAIFLPPNGGGVVYDGSYIPTEDVYIQAGSGSLGSGIVYIALQAPPDPDPVPVGSGSGSGYALEGSYYPYDIGFGSDLLDPIGSGSPLVLWLDAVRIAYQQPALGGVENAHDVSPVNSWWDQSGRMNHSYSSGAQYQRPTYYPDSVTISGAVASNPGGYVVPIDGVYQRTGTVFNAGFLSPVYTKPDGNGGFCELRQSNGWFLYHKDLNSFETSLYYNIYRKDLIPNQGLTLDSMGNSPLILGGSYGGTLSCTWGPPRISFGGNHKMFFSNPFGSGPWNSLTGATCVSVVRNHVPANDYVNGVLVNDIGGETRGAETLIYAHQDPVFYRSYGLFSNTLFPHMAALTNSSSLMSGWHIETQLATQSSLQFYVNDSLRDAVFPQSSFLSFSGNPQLGVSSYAGGIYFVGDCAEILMYNKALNSDELQTVWDYLIEKYDL